MQPVHDPVPGPFHDSVVGRRLRDQLAMVYLFFPPVRFRYVTKRRPTPGDGRPRPAADPGSVRPSHGRDELRHAATAAPRRSPRRLTRLLTDVRAYMFARREVVYIDLVADRFCQATNRRLALPATCRLRRAVNRLPDIEVTGDQPRTRPYSKQTGRPIGGRLRESDAGVDLSYFTPTVMN
jgi:hypothetical protein